MECSWLSVCTKFPHVHSGENQWKIQRKSPMLSPTSLCVLGGGRGEGVGVTIDNSIKNCLMAGALVANPVLILTPPVWGLT